MCAVGLALSPVELLRVQHTLKHKCRTVKRGLHPVDSLQEKPLTAAGCTAATLQRKDTSISTRRTGSTRGARPLCRYLHPTALRRPGPGRGPSSPPRRTSGCRTGPRLKSNQHSVSSRLRQRSGRREAVVLLRTPMARPPSATPMATPRSSSSVYTLANMPRPAHTPQHQLGSAEPRRLCDGERRTCHRGEGRADALQRASREQQRVGPREGEH